MPTTSKRLSYGTLVAGIFCGILIGAAIGVFATNYRQNMTDERTSQQRGQDLAILVCDKCHAISNNDKSRNPKAPPFRKLVEKLSSEGLGEQLEIALSLGHKPMPPWKLSLEQANDLLTFIVMLDTKSKNH